MGEVRVNRGSDDLTADFLELVCSITESDDFSWTNKCEVQRIEEKDNIFPCTKGKKIKPLRQCTQGNYSLINPCLQ